MLLSSGYVYSKLLHIALNGGFSSRALMYIETEWYKQPLIPFEGKVDYSLWVDPEIVPHVRYHPYNTD